MTDRHNDPHLREIVTGLHDSSSTMLGWIAGFGAVVLIAIVLAAGWNISNITASNASMSPAATTGNTPTLN
jgi:hypothetical protein